MHRLLGGDLGQKVTMLDKIESKTRRSIKAAKSAANEKSDKIVRVSKGKAPNKKTLV
jgi:hypothetical protein